MNKLINHIKSSLEKAEKYTSRITDEVLDMGGMSGQKTRHFYNNICSMNDARYLEIGTWRGSTLCAAMCNNNMTCVAIDNWSEFNDVEPQNDFMVNFNNFKGKNTATFIEQNCWDVDASTIGKFNIYMYDGNHSETSHHQALSHFLDCLDKEFIYLVDDWNWQHVRNGTMSSIKDNNLALLYQKEIRTTYDNSHAAPGGKHSNWHNGISIFALKKSQ